VVLKVVKPPRPEAGPALVTLLVTRSPANATRPAIIAARDVKVAEILS
jgi:hypothetical protein